MIGSQWRINVDKYYTRIQELERGGKHLSYSLEDYYISMTQSGMRSSNL